MENAKSFSQILDFYMANYAAGETHTARAKQRDLELFIDFLSKNQSEKAATLSLSCWTQANVRSFIEERLRLGEAPTSASRRLATLKHLGRIAAEHFSNVTNAARDVKNPTSPITKPKGLRDEQIGKISEKTEQTISERKNFKSFRDRAIFNLMIETGLRADEARLLRMSQLDPNLGWIRKVRTKGGKYRNVYVNSKLRLIIKDYLEKRTEELRRAFGNIPASIDKTLPVFISLYSAKLERPASLLMGAKTFYQVIRSLADDFKLHPHLLRHSFALNLLDSSKDLRLVSQALGHSDVKITMRYTERRDEEVAEAIEKTKSQSEELIEGKS
ncbi:MAG TPA: tyrosine-type recombinase/integrase [Oligoflexia bacterium]|nr:tyrosine-type recombinase/integrase [Oligoflexia bacterium]HMP27053.1 tyrosine-type recombinase/integrase [Oligoflexia bacterium]